MQLLTHSRSQSFKVCRRQHWYGYELGIRRELDGKALRMGSAYHAGLESLAHLHVDHACQSVWEYYRNTPENYDDREWEIEAETVARLLCGYAWRWENEQVEIIATEQSFRIPLLNPETDRPTPNFELAGKIDNIIRLPDGRLAVREYKLLSDELDSDASLWRRLKIDQQITTYVYAARRMGYDVDCVLYDVTRKPTIKPNAVPLLDDDGLKIVLDRDGNRVLTKQGKPRQTGDTELGYVLQTRPMTVEEWGDKLTADIAERPDFYYARREVPRLDQDVAELADELWDVQKTIRETQLRDRHYRTATKNSCDFCPVFDLCVSRFDPRLGDVLPQGYVQVSNPHPELELTNVKCPSVSAPDGPAAIGTTENTPAF